MFPFPQPPIGNNSNAGNPHPQDPSIPSLFSRPPPPLDLTNRDPTLERPPGRAARRRQQDLIARPPPFQPTPSNDGNDYSASNSAVDQCPPSHDLAPPTMMSTTSTSAPATANGLEIWAQVDCEDGWSYYYNVRTRAISWNPPSVGPSVQIYKQEDLVALIENAKHQQLLSGAEDQNNNNDQRLQNETEPFVQNTSECRRSQPVPPPTITPSAIVSPSTVSTASTIVLLSPKTTSAEPQHPNRDTVLVTPAGTPIQKQPMVKFDASSLGRYASKYRVRNIGDSGDNVNNDHHEPEKEKSKVNEAKPDGHTDTHTRFAADANGLIPIASTPVCGTPWCVVWTKAGLVFYHNSLTKSSVWVRPEELMSRVDVDEMLKKKPGTTIEAGQTQSQAETNNGVKTAGTISKTNDTTMKNCAGSTSNSVSSKTETRKSVDAVDSYSAVNEEPLQKNPTKTAVMFVDSMGKGKEQQAEIEKQQRKKLEEAGRARANVSLKTPKAQFEQLLVEKNVSSTSIWTKEQSKLSGDDRYWKLTGGERLKTFDEFVKSQSRIEWKVRKQKMQKEAEGENIDQFKAFLGRVIKSSEMTYGEFVRKYDSTPELQLVRSSLLRLKLFTENQLKLKLNETKAETAALEKKQKQREAYEALLHEKVTDYNASWHKVEHLIQDDPRYKEMEPHHERKEIFRVVCHILRAAHQKKKMERKRRWDQKPEHELTQQQQKQQHDSESSGAHSRMKPGMPPTPQKSDSSLNGLEDGEIQE